MMKDIVLVDYGMANIESVLNAFNRLEVNCIVSNEPKSLDQAHGIVLPGVGAFNAAMKNLQALRLDAALTEHVLHQKKPFLGICLGLQLIAEDSVELGYAKGLNWIRGHVTKLEPGKHLTVPHVGWNEVHHPHHSSLFERIEQGAHFYFDHSYHLQCESNLIAAQCDYGGPVVAAIETENICAVQFHPEKSQRNGLKFLRNFINFSKQN